MTREDVLKLFPDATDEQITNLLNQNNSEVAREKGKAEQYKLDAQKASELQEELDRINSQNLSEIEKANLATEAANSRVAEMEKQIKLMQTKSSLAEIGIIGEAAEKLINTDGVIDFGTLGQIITERENSAAAAKEKELLQKTPNPNGGQGGVEEKSSAERIAEKLISSSSKLDNNILSHYVNGGNQK